MGADHAIAHRCEAANEKESLETCGFLDLIKSALHYTREFVNASGVVWSASLTTNAEESHLLLDILVLCQERLVLVLAVKVPWLFPALLSERLLFLNIGFHSLFLFLGQMRTALAKISGDEGKIVHGAKVGVGRKEGSKKTNSSRIVTPFKQRLDLITEGRVRRAVVNGGESLPLL